MDYTILSPPCIHCHTLYTITRPIFTLTTINTARSKYNGTIMHHGRDSCREQTVDMGSSSVERQKGLITSLLRIQLDAVASKQTISTCL